MGNSALSAAGYSLNAASNVGYSAFLHSSTGLLGTQFFRPRYMHHLGCSKAARIRICQLSDVSRNTVKQASWR